MAAPVPASVTTTGETLTTISPATNQPILTRKAPTDAELQHILDNSQRAFDSWRHVPLPERQAIVARALKGLAASAEQLGADLVQQIGRPVRYQTKEIETAVLRGEYMLKISTEALSDTPGDAVPPFKRYIKKVPVGPVLILFAWNYPYLILVNSLIPALLAGNSVILKPSPQTPSVVESVADIFREAGLPGHVLQYFHSGSFPQISSAIQSPIIQLVCFTGSTAGGLAVQRAAADRIPVRVGLELGGKDPAYVRADADPTWAAAEVYDGAVFNAGQSCCSIERVYVHESIYEAFCAALQKELAKATLGDPTDPSTEVGPVISARAKATITMHVEDARKKGATVVALNPTNASFASAPQRPGHFVAPVMLTDVRHDMLVMREETFGPVIPVMKVRDDAQAVQLMNDSDLGLTASIWTRDAVLGERLADEVDAGTVFVNRCDYPSPDLAWVGWKNSGKGQTLSRFGFDQFVRLKSLHVKDEFGTGTTSAAPAAA